MGNELRNTLKRAFQKKHSNVLCHVITLSSWEGGQMRILYP